MGPLAGVRVLEVSNGPAGQVAGMLLADLGAEVVQYAGEAPDGAGRAGWLCWSRGKIHASSSVDPSATAVELCRLAGRADVILVDGRPSDVARVGLDATTVRSRSSRAIHVSLPPVCAAGRFSFLPADDLLLDGLSGFAYHHPSFADRPVASVVGTRRILQGTMGAVHAVAGLIGRARDGRARPAVVSGMHAWSMALGSVMVNRVDGPPLYGGSTTPDGAPHFRLYQGGDGRWFHLAALGINLFLAALDAIDRMDLFARDDVAGDFAKILDPVVGPLLAQELQRVFDTRPTEAWVDLFRAHDVPVALVGDRMHWLDGEVVAHACPPERQQHADVGALVMPGTPIELSHTPASVGRVPSMADTVDLTTIWRTVEPGTPCRASDDHDPPLAGTRVLDMATYLAGPLVATVFAHLGADVVKLEGPGGDPYRTYGGAFAAFNHLKSSLRLDLASEEGRRALLTTLAGTDVIVHNLRPASLERLGLTDDVVVSANDGLVRCSVTAYGTRGPWMTFPGFDQIIQSLSGLAAVQGGLDRPVVTGCPLHDSTAGALGALGSLAALYARLRTGSGQRVATSLTAASTLLQSAELTRFEGRVEAPIGGRDYLGPSATQRFYESSDRWIAVAAGTDDERRNLLAVVGASGDDRHRGGGHDDDPDDDPDDDHDGSAVIAAAIRSRTAEEWVAALGAAGVPAVPVTERLELDNPYLVEFGWSVVIDDPDLGRLSVSRAYGDWPSVQAAQPERELG